jgi:hypothetical protein
MIGIATMRDQNGLRVGYQKPERPMVYLDHWALRDISQEQASAKRFRDALLRRGGCLAISSQNFVEFAGVTYPWQVAAAEEFIESLLPHIYLQQIGYPWVINAENYKRCCPQGTALPNGADSDNDMLASVTAAAKQFGVPISVRGGLRTVVQEAPVHKAVTAEGVRLFIDNLKTVIFPTFERSSPRGVNDLLTKRLSWTECFVTGVMEHLYKQRHVPLDDHHVSDILHMIVPATHCDYALFDGNMCQITNVVRRRLEKLLDKPGLIASVYDKPRLEQFFTDLEGTAAAA